MHKTMTAIFLALAPVGALALVAAAPAQAQQVAVSISLFHQELAPHGRWFQHPRYGWAWFPTTVDSQWRPYAHGQWVWTESHGWYWSSDEPFGWATYHYGRWGYDQVYGWIWIPGTTWGPSWVAFRYSEGHVGWAPLPPETLTLSVGFNTGHTDMSAAYYSQRWVFVPRNRFLDARIYTSATPATQNTVYIRQTVNVTNYVTVNNAVVNRSIDRARMETAIGRRIEAARVRDVDNARKSGRRGDTEIEVYRPQVRVAPEAAPPEAARAKPADKPSYVVQKDATAPSERRDQTTQPTPPGTAQPPARPEGTSQPPPTDQERRGATPAKPATPPDQERRGATPAKPATPPAVTPGAPVERRGATPAQPATPPAAKPGSPDERRGATPAKPATPPATPDERRGATPAKPPAAIPAVPDERRGATPAQPAKPPVAGPPSGPQRDNDRKAEPAQPPLKVTPSAPPTRVETQPAPGAAPPAKPGEPPKKVEDGDNKDDKKKDEKPGR